MVYTVFYKTSSFAGYCFLIKNSIHQKRRDVFIFTPFKATLVKFQICSFIVKHKVLELQKSFRYFIRRSNQDKSVYFLRMFNSIIERK